jgi:hypothetical protein
MNLKYTFIHFRMRKIRSSEDNTYVSIKFKDLF